MSWNLRGPRDDRRKYECTSRLRSTSPRYFIVRYIHKLRDIGKIAIKMAMRYRSVINRDNKKSDESDEIQSNCRIVILYEEITF